MRERLRPSRLPAIALVALLLSAVAACSAEPAPPAEPGRVTILYTGGVLGTLTPCGCSPGQLGGIARVASLVKAVRKSASAVIVVDAGERLFLDTAADEETLGPQNRLKAAFIQKAYGALGAAVVNLGAHDLVGGTALAVDEAKEAGAAPLSANLFLQKGLRKAPAQAAMIVEAGGVRVAFIGVMDPASLSASEQEAFRGADPIARARASVEAFRPEADAIIVLSTLSRKANLNLAKRVPGIDVVIGSGAQGRARNIVVPLEAAGRFVVQVKPLGEYVGRIDLAPAPGGAAGLVDVTETEDIQGARPEGAVATEGLQFGDDLDLRGAPARPERSPIKALPPVEPGTVRHTVYAVGDYLAEDAGMQRLMNAYKLKVAELNRSAPVTATRLPTEGAAYAGDAACRSCHESISDFVATLSHARAYATLEKAQSEYDLECVGCHVTGWKKPGGFDHPAAVGNLKNVQCESCHGPGSDHVAAGGARGVGNMKADVPLAVCRGCHTPAHSTGFAADAEAYLDRIRCSQAVLADAAARAGRP